MTIARRREENRAGMAEAYTGTLAYSAWKSINVPVYSGEARRLRKGSRYAHHQELASLYNLSTE